MKVIFIISPNTWGDKHVSKHHYAIELARMGNEVYFINTPNQDKKVKLYSISKIEGYDNLYLVNYYLIKNKIIDYCRFKLNQTWFYDYLLRLLMLKIIKDRRLTVDQIWNFDPNLHGHFYKYPAAKKIFFIADQIKLNAQKRSAKKVDAVISVANEILQQFKMINKNCFLINHGLSSSFKDAIMERQEEINKRSSIKKVGYVGNLFIKYLNLNVLENIINLNPNIEFYFWGATNNKNNNLGQSADLDKFKLIERISKLSNVKFCGVKNQLDLITEIMEMDAFVMCYDVEFDPNKGANSHKIMEYLSTGKVIIANKVLDYVDKDLFPMLNDSNTDELVNLFSKVIADPAFYNSESYKKKRITYALENTYQKNIQKINQFIQ